MRVRRLLGSAAALVLACVSVVACGAPPPSAVFAKPRPESTTTSSSAAPDAEAAPHLPDGSSKDESEPSKPDALAAVTSAAPLEPSAVRRGEPYAIVVLQVSKETDPTLVDTQKSASSRGWNPVLSRLSCTKGAAAKLGRDEAQSAVVLFFTSETQARQFASQHGRDDASVITITADCDLTPRP